MAVEHRNIADPEIHEPKGVSTAAANTTYVASGSGSGTWTKIPVQGLSGIAGAGIANQIPVSNGAGGFYLAWSVANGGVFFTNIASPNVITYPSVYTKISPTTTVAGTPRDFGEGTNARVTYLGTQGRMAVVTIEAVVSQSSGADREIRVALYKNGSLVTGAESVLTVENNHRRQINLEFLTPVVTNDFFEAFVRNDGASGDVSVHTLKLRAIAALT